MSTKIAILVPSLHGGGAERVALTIASHLADGHEVTMVLLERGQEYDLPAGVGIVQLTDVDGRASRLTKLLAVPRQIWRLRRFLREFRPAAALALLERPVVYLGLVGPATGARLIASFRNHESNHLRNTEVPSLQSQLRFAVYRRLLAAAARRFHHLNFLSHAARQDFCANFVRLSAESPPASSVIYNGYDVERIQSEARSALSPELTQWMRSRFVVASMGRIETQKGHLNLIEAIARARRAEPRIAAVIIGDGSLKGQVRSAAERHGLTVADLSGGENLPAGADPDVVITGFRRNPYPLIREAACFAFPSLWEGFGNALVEAMAVGQVVVSADCECGPREVLGVPLDARPAPVHRVDCGYLIAGNDPDRWGEVFRDLAAEPEESRAEMRSAASERARSFSLITNRDEWRALVDDVLAHS